MIYSLVISGIFVGWIHWNNWSSQWPWPWNKLEVQDGAPPQWCLLVYKPHFCIDTSTINHSEMEVMFTNLANELGHHLVRIPYMFGLIFRPMVQGISPDIFWPNIWYSTSILRSWNSHWSSRESGWQSNAPMTKRKPRKMKLWTCSVVNRYLGTKVFFQLVYKDMCVCVIRHIHVLNMEVWTWIPSVRIMLGDRL